MAALAGNATTGPLGGWGRFWGGRARATRRQSSARQCTKREESVGSRRASSADGIGAQSGRGVGVRGRRAGRRHGDNTTAFNCGVPDARAHADLRVLRNPGPSKMSHCSLEICLNPSAPSESRAVKPTTRPGTNHNMFYIRNSLCSAFCLPEVIPWVFSGKLLLLAKGAASRPHCGRTRPQRIRFAKSKTTVSFRNPADKELRNKKEIASTAYNTKRNEQPIVVQQTT